MNLRSGGLTVPVTEPRQTSGCKVCFDSMRFWLTLVLCVPFSCFGQDQVFSHDSLAFSVDGHAQCVRITGREVFHHGLEGRWSPHWWRMSYVGRACERENGRKRAVAYEALFAFPHYTSMFFINVAGLTKRAFTQRKKRHPRPEKVMGD